MATGDIHDNQRPITIITANVGYASNDYDPYERKTAIVRLLETKNPTIVILQESRFKQIGSNSAHWRDFHFPDKYKAKIKSDEVKFLYDSKKIKLKLVDAGEIQKANDHLSNTASGLPQAMTLMVVAEPIDESKPKFLCVSWHGKYKADSDTRRKDLKMLFEIVTRFSENMNLPVIIGGDFNAPFSGIASVLEETGSSLVGYDYRPSRRRSFSGAIDFFLSSSSLTLKDVAPVDWGSEKANKLLDHDPIFAEIQFNPDENVQVIEEAFQKLTINEGPRRSPIFCGYL